MENDGNSRDITREEGAGSRNPEETRINAALESQDEVDDIWRAMEVISDSESGSSRSGSMQTMSVDGEIHDEDAHSIDCMDTTPTGGQSEEVDD